MVRFKLVGQTSYQIGKPLWEIIGNLENNGIGRLITRGMFLRYPEPSFYKVVKVETVPAAKVEPNEFNEYARRCIVWVEFTFRGILMKEYREIYWPTYKPDYQLIPKEEEELWYKRVEACKREIKIIDPHVKMPVILQELYKEHLRRRGDDIPAEIKLRAQIVRKFNNQYRLAEDGETPNYKLEYGFGTPKTPSLYENIEAARHLFVGINEWDDPPPTKKIDWMAN